MATSCEDVTAHLMELLYGELAPGERASIEGHVASCGRCRRMQRSRCDGACLIARGGISRTRRAGGIFSTVWQRACGIFG